MKQSDLDNIFKEYFGFDTLRLELKNYIVGKEGTQIGSSPMIYYNIFNAYHIYKHQPILFVGPYKSLYEQFIPDFMEFSQAFPEEYRIQPMLSDELTAGMMKDIRKYDLPIIPVLLSNSNQILDKAMRFVGNKNHPTVAIADECDTISGDIEDWFDEKPDKDCAAACLLKLVNYKWLISTTCHTHTLESFTEYDAFPQIEILKAGAEYTSIQKLLKPEHINIISDEIKHHLKNKYSIPIELLNSNFFNGDRNQLNIISTWQKGGNKSQEKLAADISKYTNEKHLGATYTQEGIKLFKADGSLIKHDYLNPIEVFIDNLEAVEPGINVTFIMDKKAERGTRIRGKNSGRRISNFLMTIADKNPYFDNTIQKFRHTGYGFTTTPKTWITVDDFQKVKDCAGTLKTWNKELLTLNNYETTEEKLKARDKLIIDNPYMKISKRRKMSNFDVDIHGKERIISKPTKEDKVVTAYFEITIFSELHLSETFFGNGNSEKATEMRNHVRNFCLDRNFTESEVSNMRGIYEGREGKGGGTDTQVYVNRNRGNINDAHKDRLVLYGRKPSQPGVVAVIITIAIPNKEDNWLAHDLDGNFSNFGYYNRDNNIIKPSTIRITEKKN